MKRLTKTQILKMHSLLIQKTGGSDGVRDEGLLDSALIYHSRVSMDKLCVIGNIYGVIIN